MFMRACRDKELANASLSTWWSTKTYQHTSMRMTDHRRSSLASSARTSTWLRTAPKPIISWFSTNTSEKQRKNRPSLARSQADQTITLEVVVLLNHRWSNSQIRGDLPILRPLTMMTKTRRSKSTPIHHHQGSSDRTLQLPRTRIRT